MKRLMMFLLYGALMATPLLAQDPGKGRRGPTPTQVDVRASYENGSLTQQYIGKVWTGDENGGWGVINARTTDGDLDSILLLGGPRFRRGNLHALTFLGNAFGLDDNVADVFTTGIFATYVLGDAELTGTLQYVDPEDTLPRVLYGLSYAETVSDHHELGVGFTADMDNIGTDFDARLVYRFIASRHWHVRVSYDLPVNNHETNKSRAEAVLRVNLPFFE